MEGKNDAQMTRTVICARCQCPQRLTEQRGNLPDDVHCSSCGALLPRSSQVAAVPTTILCIDDEPLILHFYQAFLDERGYRVLTASEGLAGIELAQRERPDVILLDIMLRGLSGFDICRKLRADPVFRTVPIILITAWHDTNVAQTGRQAGATLTLRKPDDVETLPAIIEEVVRESSSPPRAEEEA